MQKDGILSKDEKWNAVISCNKNYDGLFYYAVKTTGIFCKPSCRAKVPLKENTIFFDNAEDAVKEGFRACKLCRPDIIERSYEPNKELIQNIKEMLNDSYNESHSLKAISQEFGISTSHLTRLFKEYSGVTFKEYMIHLRINKFMLIINEGKFDILEAAYEVGFRSMSSFYKQFKDQVGCTPKEYRYRMNNINVSS